MAGLESYANGTKETWRGWQWNRIVERLPGWKPDMGPAFYRNLCSDKTVLYLCGPDDFDRNLALKKGFRNENLIACDLDKNNCDRVRMSGGIAVNYNLIDAVRFWNQSNKIDVLIADFCFGLTNSALHFAMAIAGSNGFSSLPVISVNLLHGRDPQTNALRASLAKNPLLQKYPMLASHRGALFSVMLSSIATEGLDFSKQVELFDVMRPMCRSYRSVSGNQYFDCSIFRWIGSTVKLRSSESSYWKSLRNSTREAGSRVSFDRRSFAAHLAKVTQQRKALAT